jgi:hypothetical protein
MIFALAGINNFAQLKILYQRAGKHFKRYQIFSQQFYEAKFPKLGMVLFPKMGRKMPACRMTWPHTGGKGVSLIVPADKWLILKSVMEHI